MQVNQIPEVPSIRFRYKGEAKNLGRHGAVKPGQILVMTQHEAFTVAEDSRFEPLSKDTKVQQVAETK
jgi:hypothetical protein